LTIRQLIIWGSNELQTAQIEEFKNDAKTLMMFLLKTDNHKLVLNYNNAVGENIINQYKNLIEQRKTKKPLQYIIGSWEFYSLWFELSPDTLIPRADTEILVDEVLKKVNKHITIKLLDLCTGSGCIGISLLKSITNSTAVLVDKVYGAADMAKKNCMLNGVKDRAKVITADIYEITFADNEFDVIVSNPPYIKSGDIKKLDKSVREFEPLIALDGGENGLDFYECIIKRHTNSLKSGVLMAFEIGDSIEADTKMSENIKTLFLDNGYKNIEIVNDLNKIQRVITAQKI
jgi:release factor glutamine methyltransferase